MVKGIDVFRKYFEEFSDQYVLIGGVACDIMFAENEVDFRATKDMDIVLLVEAQTKEFGHKFWQFINEGGYENRLRGDGKAQFYRFDKPKKVGYPTMIELFARTNNIICDDNRFTSIHIDDAIYSLSAILLDDVYYQILIDGRVVIEGISVLKPTWIVPLKVKAWLDLREKAKIEHRIDSRDIKKHKNDILRMVSELVLEPCELPEKIKQDMRQFVDELQVTQTELKNLHITGVYEDEIKQILKEIYRL